MFVFGNLLTAIAAIIGMVLQLFMWVIIARAILSWVSPDPFNPIVRFIHNVTEPVLYQVRSRIPFNLGGIDISPIIVILLILFLRLFLVDSLRDLSMAFR